MARYYKRKFNYRKRKYNIENRPVEFSSPNNQENGFYQNQIQIVPPTATEGVRQVARMTVTLTGANLDGTGDTMPNIYWALVYIPEGAVTSSLFPNANTLFQPSNYVLSSGIADSSAGPIRISSRLKKNLNASDQIFLLTASKQQGVYQGLVRYAIAFH